MAETTDLKSVKCEFESHPTYHFLITINIDKPAAKQ